MAITTLNTLASSLYENSTQYNPFSVQGPSDLYKTYEWSTPKDKTVATDYEAKYWNEKAMWDYTNEVLTKQLSELKPENEALKKALEGFVGVTI